MFDAVRDALYRVITSPVGDSLGPVRLPKDLARRINATFGSPLAPRDELTRREAARRRLATLREARLANGGMVPEAPQHEEAAPVMVYFEKDRGARELARIEETLTAKRIPYKLLDVTGDESTLDFVLREAGCEKDELPVVFVAGAAIGNFPKVVEADVSGELRKAVYGV